MRFLQLFKKKKDRRADLVARFCLRRRSMGTASGS
jgi:hypothetical protein